MHQGMAWLLFRCPKCLLGDAVWSSHEGERFGVKHVTTSSHHLVGFKNKPTSFKRDFKESNHLKKSKHL